MLFFPTNTSLICQNLFHAFDCWLTCLQEQSEKERIENKEAVGARLIRRLSMRPTVEELVDRNILKTQSAAEERKSKEEKKKMLLRKLSFRPTVEELKEKKVCKIRVLWMEFKFVFFRLSGSMIILK